MHRSKMVKLTSPRKAPRHCAELKIYVEYLNANIIKYWQFLCSSHTFS